MPEIELSLVRVTTDCLQRWQRESGGRIRPRQDGRLDSDNLGYVHVFKDGRLRISCELPSGMIFLTAEPHEWSRDDHVVT